MLNIITFILIIIGLGSIGGLCGGIGFAYVVAKLIDKRIDKYTKILDLDLNKKTSPEEEV